MANLLDKNDRAIRAFIASTVAGVGASIPIYIRNDERTRDQQSGGLVDVDTSAGTESPPGSGCYMVNVMVRGKMPAAAQPDDTSANEWRDAMSTLTVALHNVLHQTDNHQDYTATAGAINTAAYALAASDPTGNGDLANYTCLNVVHNNLAGGKPSDEESISFVELINFQCLVAGVSNLF